MTRMNVFVRILHAVILAGFTLAILIPTMQTETPLFAGGECQDQSVCRQNADIGKMVDEMLKEQIVKFKCEPLAKGVFPRSALVRHAKMSDGDTGVVVRESSDVAWAEAKSGHIYVLKWCK